MGAGGRGNPNVAAPLVGAVGAGAVGQGGWERLIPQCPKEAGHNELRPYFLVGSSSSFSSSSNG